MQFVFQLEANTLFQQMSVFESVSHVTDVETMGNRSHDEHETL